MSTVHRWKKAFSFVVFACSFAFLIALHHCVLPQRGKQTMEGNRLTNESASFRSAVALSAETHCKGTGHCASIYAVLPSERILANLSVLSSESMKMTAWQTSATPPNMAPIFSKTGWSPPASRLIYSSPFYRTTFSVHAPPSFPA